MSADDKSEKELLSWRDKLGIGNKEMPRISGEFTLAPTSTNDQPTQKLRSQREAAERLAEERVVAARERSMPADATKMQSLETQTNYSKDLANPNQEIGVGMGSEELSRKNGRSVFIIHGRNSTLTESLSTFLRSINLKPIEFSIAIQKTIEHEKKGGNPSIGSILDHVFEDAAALIVLFSPDDQVQLRENLWSKREKPLEKKLNFQARPNVIFEAGMALGRHPEKTVFVTVGKVKEFSDIAGKHMMFLDNTSKSRRQLAKRLESMGCPIDLDGDDWESAGTFRAR